MPLATAAWDARARRRVAAAAIATALQGVFYWLILHEAIRSIALPTSTPLEVTLIASTRRPGPHLRKARQRVTPPAAVAPPKEAAPPAQPITVPPPAQPALHGPLDWQQALQDELRAEESRSRGGKLQFGFPQQPAPFAAAPEFGWDYAHTHRVQVLPAGGVLIMLNDHCALVIYVILPLAGCNIGRIPANGQLFENMRDPRNARTGGLP